jgi:hypothetical protein
MKSNPIFKVATWILRLGECELIFPDQKGVAEVVPDGHFKR